jgi:WD40 repeat protein
MFNFIDFALLNATRLIFADSNVNVLQGHKDRVLSVQWHPNGLNLASASKDTTIKIWNFDQGKV